MTENLEKFEKSNEYKPKKCNNDSITLSSEILKSILNRLQEEELQKCISELTSCMQELSELDENSKQALKELIENEKTNSNNMNIKSKNDIKPRNKTKKQQCILL